MPGTNAKVRWEAMRTTYACALGWSALCAAGAVLWPAMPQPLEYHEFGDRRAWLGLANFLDVVSNLGFLAAGLLGLRVAARRATVFERASERGAYLVFFAGVLLTACGSSWYHLAPGNERLYWDRLPIAIAFLALVAAQIAERVSLRAGVRLLAPLVLLGVAAVVHWRATERAGAGNVIPYGILQGWAIALIVLLAWRQPSRYTHAREIYGVFAWYALAKVCELFDRQIYALGELVSGHTLKHLAAAVGVWLVARMLARRALVRTDAHGERAQPVREAVH